MLRGFNPLYIAELQDCGERFGGCELVTRSFLGLCRACREASKSDGASSVHNVDWSCCQLVFVSSRVPVAIVIMMRNVVMSRC